MRLWPSPTGETLTSRGGVGMAGGATDAGQDGSIVFWKRETGEHVSTIRNAHKSAVVSCSWVRTLRSCSAPPSTPATPLPPTPCSLSSTRSFTHPRSHAQRLSAPSAQSGLSMCKSPPPHKPRTPVRFLQRRSEQEA